MDIQLMSALRSESQIMAGWGERRVPLVSIACTTYNHARYVDEALCGFLSQVTDFPFEIVVHDDASTDRTRDIVDRYAQQYPHIIRTIYQPTNRYSQGVTSAIIAFEACRAKYVAFCEGDDYWTDPQKLQLQCAFLESELDYTLVFHNCRLRQEAKGDSLDEVACFLTKTTFTLADVVRDGWFIPSQSMMFRRDALELPSWLHRVFGLDYAMHLFLAQRGRLGYIDRIMGVYRINAASVSGNRPPGFFQIKHIQTLSYFNFHTGFVHNEIIASRLDHERQALYFAYLNGRPWYVRALSLDYFRFKLANLRRRRARSSPQPKAVPSNRLGAV